MLYSSSNTGRDKYESMQDLFGESLLCSYKGTLKLFFATTPMKKKYAVLVENAMLFQDAVYSF